MEASTMSDEDLSRAIAVLQGEHKHRERLEQDRTNTLFHRLPDKVNGVLVKDEDGGWFQMHADSSYTVEMPWRLWVELAEAIIAADAEARAYVDGRQITNVCCFDNGMTAVFDQHGQQMCAFQGRTDDVMPRIRATGWTGQIEHEGESA